MQLKDLIKIADSAYPDELVSQFFEGHDMGDTLAKFIVRELKDTYDSEASSKDQLQDAQKAIEKASWELQEVVDAFDKALKMLGD